LAVPRHVSDWRSRLRSNIRLSRRAHVSSTER
jgi:hypothetical protein